jgi:hypothetical protein
MIRRGIVEDNEAMLACFFGGLNKEIQHILDYKEYNTITRLFHLTCKAELEVRDCQPSWRRANNSADNEMEVMGAETADQYKSLVAQCILSVQLSKVEHDRCHNLFQTRGIVNDRAIWIIIDGGRCNNLASIDMAEKLPLSTWQRPHPYYIEWFESSCSSR